ncbi:MAG: sorbosone dehydrogenase family protein, partial [Proteobacteria bacterium]
MKKTIHLLALGLFTLTTVACDDDDNDSIERNGVGIGLTAPDASHDAKTLSQVQGWPAGTKPTAPAGFQVTELAGGLDNPRWLHVLPNGDILVAEANTLNNGAQEVN